MTQSIFLISKRWKSRFFNPIQVILRYSLLTFRLFVLTLFWRRPVSYRNQSMICGGNQWTGFYMIMASVMKRLNATNCFLLNLGAVVQRLFCTKGVLRNFTKFTGKHQCQSLFLNKVAGLMSATLLKKRLWHRCCPVNFMKFLRTPFYIEHLWWRLL